MREGRRDPSTPLAERSTTSLLGEAAALFLVYALIAAWWLWPLPAKWQDHAVHSDTGTQLVQADVDLVTWVLAWDVHALTTQPSRLFDANIFYPAPKSLAFSEHLLGYLPLFAPILLASGNPVLASNLTLYLTFPLCGLAMYALARRFVPRAPAFLAGFLFAFCGLRYFTLWHLHMLGVFWMPLALLLTERWLEKAATRDAVLLGLALLCQLLSSYYLAYSLMALYGAYLPVALWQWRRRLDGRRWLGLALAGVGAALPVILLSFPYIEMRKLGLIRSYVNPGPPWNAMLMPGVTRWRIEDYLSSRGVGPVGYALALIALLPPWRDAPRARPIAVVAIVTGLVMAAGPALLLFGVELWSPYEWLLAYVPGFDAVRLPRRFLVVSQLGFSLIAAVGLARVLTRASARLAWPIAAACALLAIWTWSPFPPLNTFARPTGSTLPPAVAWLAEHGDGRPLLEIPLGTNGQAAERMLESTHHWLPMIDGYSGYPPPTKALFGRIAEGLPDPRALAQLVNLGGVGWILVHLEGLPPEMRKRWTDEDLPGLERVSVWDDAALLRVTMPVGVDLRARLLARDATPEGVPLRAIEGPCPGRIEVLLGSTAESVNTGESLPVSVTIVNQSDSAWPGLAVFPDQLVQVRASILDGDREAGTATTHPLDVDVPAGEARQANFRVAAPASPGTYTLELAAVQGDRRLEDCGLTSARVALPAVVHTPAPSPSTRPSPSAAADG